jgi:trimeric autotransporter adhesin
MKTKIVFFVICNLIICNLQFSQNITNTLGSSGVFTLKDNSTTYLSLSQSTGNLSLSRGLELINSNTSNTGIVYMNGLRFLHNYYPLHANGYNTFLGVNAGNFSMDGMEFESSYNTGVGHSSLSSITIGKHNTALGNKSLITNTTGYNNTAVGSESMFQNAGGINNTAIGFQSLYYSISGMNNTALGMQSLMSNNTGHNNTAVGYYSLRSNSGSENTAVGYQSLFSNTINTGNTAVGFNSLYSNTGWNNTSVGHHSLNSNTTGNYNTAFGYNAGSTITTGANLTCLGIDAAPTSPTAIDQVTLGNGFVSSLRCNVQTITSLSDARDKKNISELSLGLDFITKLHPRQFNWDKREWYDGNISDGSKMKEAPTAGFIAQELDEVQQNSGADWLNLVLKDNPDKWEATYGNLLPVMVKAIQELKAENDELKKEIETLKTVNEKVGRLEEIINGLSSVKNTTLTENK